MIFRFPFFSARQIRREIDAELRFHFDARIEELVALGRTRDEARAEAVKEFGDLDEVRRDLRDIDERLGRRRERGEWLQSVRQDVVYAVRSLRRAPGVTAGIVVTLALGLGVNLAMFSFLDVVFLRPPAGVHRPDEVRRVWTERQFVSGVQYWPGFSYPQYAGAQSTLGDRAATALYRYPRPTRYGAPGDESQVRVSWANASYFPLLGVRPEIGRFFTPDEDRLGAGVNVAVASHPFWTRQFGSDSAALGSEVLVEGRRYTLIGIAAEGFSGVDLDATELWLPVGSMPAYGPGPWWRNHIVNGFQFLIRPSSATGDRALEDRIAAGLRTPEALRVPGDTVTVVRVGSIIVAQGPGNKQQEVKIATRLAGVTIIVLLIACANVINLLLARAVRRRQEIAVRLAMGISRLRLMRLLLTESVLLALLAGAAAVLAAYWGGALLRALLLPDVAWAASILHWRMLALALAGALVLGLVAGLLPAIQSAKTELTSALKAGAGDSHARRSRLRGALVVAQAALSVVLLVGAGLFVRSLDNVRDLRIGFDTQQIIIATTHFDTRDSVRDARFAQVLREVGEHLRAAPGVERVALVSDAPKREISWISFFPDVDTTRIASVWPTYNGVSPEFFAATGMRVLRGSGFPDVPPSAMPRVVVVNEAMARAQWPGMDAIGRCLRFEADGECYTVVGVVETALVSRLLEKPGPQFYLPLDNMPPSGQKANYILVRVEPRSRQALMAQMRAALLETFPGSRPSITTMESLLEPEYRPWRLGATLFTAFGILALIVAAVGIYSTVAYTVAQRTHEFGVRMALGARLHDILSQVIGGSLRVVAIGVAAGIALAIAGGRFVAALLYEVEPSDPGVMAGVAVALLLIASAAALGPAWRAARVDPVTALRSE